MESDMAVYGYARVSTGGQLLFAQLAELQQKNARKYFKISGARSDRKHLVPNQPSEPNNATTPPTHSKSYKISVTLLIILGTWGYVFYWAFL
jgi:hypothetical protein